jgi:hypothetical protein
MNSWLHFGPGHANRRDTEILAFREAYRGRYGGHPSLPSDLDQILDLAKAKHDRVPGSGVTAG